MNAIFVIVISLAIVGAELSAHSLSEILGEEGDGPPKMVQMCGSQLIDFMTPVCNVIYKQRKMRTKRWIYASEGSSGNEIGDTEDADEDFPMTYVSDNRPKFRPSRSLINNCCKNACPLHLMGNYC